MADEKTTTEKPVTKSQVADAKQTEAKPQVSPDGDKKEYSKELKIGNTTFYVPSLKDKSKNEFLNMYKNMKIDFQLDNAWFRIQERLTQLGLTGNPKYKDDVASVGEQTKANTKA